MIVQVAVQKGDDMKQLSILVLLFFSIQSFAYELGKLNLSSQSSPQGGWQCYKSVKVLTIDSSSKTFFYSDHSGGCYGPFASYRGYYVESYTEYNRLLKISFIAEKSGIPIINSTPRKIFEAHIDLKKSKFQIYGLGNIYNLYDFKILAETEEKIQFKEYKFDQVEYDVAPNLP